MMVRFEGSVITMTVVTPNANFVQEVVENGGDTVDMCFQCGTCTASCPSGRQTSFRTRKLVRMAQLGMKDQIIESPDLWMCTTCYTCTERCPRNVKIVDIIIAMRNIAVQNGKMNEDHKKVASSFIVNGHTVPLNDKIKALRKSMGLAEVPPTVLADDKAMADFQKLLGIVGFKDLVGVE
jgi:heterodisulfide reductase subunit C